MPEEMTYAQAILAVAAELAPFFVSLIIIFVVFSWLRVLVDKMSGRGF